MALTNAGSEAEPVEQSSHPEVEQHSKILHGRFGLLVQLYPVLVLFNILKDFRGPFVVVPKARTQRELLFVIDFISSVCDVKETSPGRSSDPS